MRSITTLLMTAVVLISCNTEPTLIKPEQDITSLVITATPEDGGPVAVFTMTDPDGYLASEPIITADSIRAMVPYTLVLEAKNETISPTEDLVAKIMANDTLYQWFYILTDINGASTYKDVDQNNKPLGIKSALGFVATGEGTMNTRLKIDLNKSKTGISQNDPSQAGGRTLIDISFPIKVVQ
jgi:hypothetical protein